MKSQGEIPVGLPPSCRFYPPHSSLCHGMPLCGEVTQPMSVSGAVGLGGFCLYETIKGGILYEAGEEWLLV